MRGGLDSLRFFENFYKKILMEKEGAYGRKKDDKKNSYNIYCVGHDNWTYKL